MGLVKRTYVDGETVITADNLNDIQDAIIQNEEDITTKGTYSKPSGGIPKTDLASAVQTSLGKADTALQSSDIDNTLTVSGKAADAKKTGDEISGLKNTLSHKADVIYDTASGDIASFPDGADGLPVKDLTVAIEPVQSGTGDPSPTNVRPISGRTGCNVTRTGKNLLHNTGASGTYNNVAYTKNEDGSLNKESGTANGWAGFPLGTVVLTPGSYILSSGIDSANQYNFYIYANLGETNYNTSSGSKSFTVSETTECVLSAVSRPKVSVPALTMYPMIRLASDTDPTFAPYIDTTTIPISWQSSAGTVYGGTLNVTTGVLTVDSGYVDLTAYANLTLNNTNTTGKYRIKVGDTGYWESSTSNAVAVLGLISNQYKSVPAGSAGTYGCNTGVSVAESGELHLFDANIQTIEAARQAGIVICAKLAQPQTYQLDPVTLSTLLGENNIWADCGPSTVEYPADTKLYIQKINAPSDDDMIADAQIASGKYFIVNNNLYLSTTTILAGDPIKPGTNCTLTNLAAALNSLNS